jgi:long-chain acyl-CoA synthetase
VKTQPPLFELAGRDPDGVALEDGTARRTWGELDHRSRAIAHGLRAMVPPGSHVALVASNRVEFIEVALGCLRAGLVYTPIKSSWTPVEITSILTDASTALVVTDMEGARRAASDSELPVVDLDDGFDSWVSRQTDAPLPYELAGRKVTYTSGTTGRPKGVVPAYQGLRPFALSFAASARMAEVTGLPGEGAHLFVSHLFHGAPLTFGLGALARGATVRIVPRWDPEVVLHAMADGVTSTSMVPTMFRQLLRLPVELRSAFHAPELVTVLHGGEACPLPVKRAMLATSEEWLERPGTVGRPRNRQRILIVDDAGQEVGPGLDGTIYFATPDGVTFSYLNDEAKTAAAHRGSAFTVGDVGHLDEAGYLYVTGRKSDVIISAAVNIYPAEIESVLGDIEGLADLAIVGAPDELRGEQVAAVIVTAADGDANDVAARLGAVAAERLAGYKRPRLIFEASSLPRDPTGKLLRNALRDQVAHGSEGMTRLPDPPSTPMAAEAIAPTRKGRPS